MAQNFVAFALWISLDFEIVSDVLACDDPLQIFKLRQNIENCEFWKCLSPFRAKYL